MLAADPIERPLSDELLAERARQGSRGAFVALVSRYERRVFRLARRMSRNDADAEEITQETFLRCFRSLDSFHGDSRFGTWLYRVAMNEALMRLRAERRRPTQSLEGVQALAGDPSADDLVDDKRLLERVREALGRIDEARRAALVLRDLEELSAEEAGEILGVSPETVRQRAHRARLELCASLADVMSAHSPRGGRGAGNATLRAVP